MIKNQKFSSEFVSNLIEITEGIISSNSFGQFYSALEHESTKHHLSKTTEANLSRILHSVYDRTSFILDLIKYPHHLEIICAISSTSNYLTDIVVRNPEYLYQTFNQNYLSKNIEEKELEKEVNDGIRKFKSHNSKCNFLRQLKKRYILKIGLTDILGIFSLEIITDELSLLAKIINACLFEACYKEILAKYNLEFEKHDYCLCSLGKLGGCELNYSSDVDLLLFYEHNFTINKINKEYHDFLNEVVLLFIKSSTEITDKGYIYRIDFRLRPDGKYSPLCKALPDYIKYYEIRGEDWERQMLIKLNFVSGNYDSYNKFKNLLQPYIYPSSFSTSPYENIRKMKLNIEKHNKELENVKLFTGGIRDIEFSIQALQLLNGGKYKELRLGNSLNTIEQLYLKNLISQKEREILSEAYIFYRKIEHFLQLMNDTQTHLIPQKGDLLNKLIHFLNLDTSDNFFKKLNKLRKLVREVYNDILTIEKTETKCKINFKDEKKAGKNLKYLRTGSGLFSNKEFDTRTIEQFSKIESALLKHLSNSQSPDIVLDNFVKIIHAVKFPSIWYYEFYDNKFLRYFLLICEYSSRAVEIVASNSTAADMLLTRKVLIKLSVNDYLKYNIGEIIYSLSVQCTIRLISSEVASNILSQYLRKRIAEYFSSKKLNTDYVICGLGSFAANTMTFSSDIDLIVVIENINEAHRFEKDFIELISKIQKELNPFKIEFRLRPEGKSSQLIWDFASYEKYFNTRARIWEFQALSKINFVCGSEVLFKKFVSSIIKKVSGFETTYIKAEILKMHRAIQNELIIASSSTFNIKKQSGGLSTIDFIIQSIILSDTDMLKKMLGKNTLNILKYLQKKINTNDFVTLIDNYLFLRKIIFALQTIFIIDNYTIPSNIDKRIILARYLKFNSVHEFDSKLNYIIKSTNNLFEKYVGKS